MRVVAFIGAVVASTALTAGAMVLVVLLDPQPDGWLFVAALSVALLLYGPLTLGSLHAYWDDRRSTGAGSVFRVWQIVVASLEAVGAVGICVWTIGVGAPSWIPVLFVGTAAVLSVVAVVVGRALGRLEERQAPFIATQGLEQLATVSRNAVRRAALVIVLTFVIAIVVTGTGLALLFALLLDEDPAVSLVFALQFSCFAASFAAILVVLPMNRALRDATGRDLGRARAFGKVVVRGKKVSLAPEDEPAAAQYAAVASVSLPFQLTYFLLLYAGLALGQVPNLFDEDRSWFSVALLAFLLIVLVVIVPLLVSQIRRARRYAREHPVLTAQELPTP